MKVVCWNINGRSSNITDNAADFISENLQDNSEIIVFTEYTLSFGRLSKNLEELGYITFSNLTKTRENGVLIGVKSEDIEIKQVFNLCPSTDDMQPNFFGVQLKKDNESINIIGTRIRVDTKQYKTDAETNHDFKDRARQSVNLLHQLDLNKIEGKIIIVGDFNNGFYRENDKLSDYKNARRYFNYKMLKNMMNEKGFTAYTPKYGYSLENNLKYDHAFAKGLKVKQPRYDWTFTTPSSKKSTYEGKTVGYPDHAQLLLDIDF